MAQTTRNLGLPLLAASQAQKHVIHNEALDRIDALVHLACLSRTLAAPPPDPPEGARYLVAAENPGGAWEGLAGRIVLREDGVWVALAPRPGWLAYIHDESVHCLYDGAAWLPWPAATTTLQHLGRLGIGTQADAANPFAARLNAALWTAREPAEGGSGDLRIALNKPSPSEVLSLVFQSGYSGRAEFGLLASDNLTLKVSPDGGTWRQAFSVDRTTGFVSFDQGTLRVETSVLAASGTWTKPAWARQVVIFAMGGGGGGGAGRRGAVGSVRAGGGGGGAGALNVEEFPADDLPSVLTITIGAGGGGGGAQGADSANGAAGVAGGTTVVANGASSLLVAVGGGGGGGGGATAGVAGVAGQGLSVAVVGPGGAGSAGAAAGGGGNGVQGSGGGGGGGGISAAEAPAAGGASGYGYLIGGASRRAAITAGGGVGLAGTGGIGKVWERGSASGGGGGGAGPANGSGAGGAGGVGGPPGGGGGGGGGSTNGAPSGAGGAGARGEVWIVCRG